MNPDFEFVLNKLLNSSIEDKRQQAYVLATIKHETANTFKPIKEYGSKKYLKSKKYYPYFGRGYIQLTWLQNYKNFSDLLGVDLVDDPDLALNPEISWIITEVGMTEGKFTDKKLSDYFNETKTDYRNARRIINGIDKADLVAKYAKEYLVLLSELPQSSSV